MELTADSDIDYTNNGDASVRRSTEESTTALSQKKENLFSSTNLSESRLKNKYELSSDDEDDNLELDLDYLERPRGGDRYEPEATSGSATSKEEDSPADSLERVKVVFLGAPGVGKSSIIRQFVWSEFSEEYRPTERRETYYPSVVLAERMYELKITDLPTIPYFPVSSALEWTDFRYYGLRSATAYVLVFDLSNQDTFQYIRTLREQIYEARDMRGVPLLVVGNKQDKLSSSTSGAAGSGGSGGAAPVVPTARHRDIVNLVRKHWRCGYVECSARFNCRVVQVFRELMKGIQALEGTPSSPTPTGSQPMRGQQHHHHHHHHHQGDQGGAGAAGLPVAAELSMTRGVPSTSTDLKEALCEKIPLHHDLLRRFRQHYGPEVVSQITVNDIYRGLADVNALIRETSEADSKSGIKYRGLSMPELFDLLPRRGNSPSPEAVFWLLLTGDVPTHEQTDSLMADWLERRDKRRDWWWSEASGEIGGVVGNILRAVPKSVSPPAKLAIALTALDADKHYKRALQDGAMSYTYWEHIYEDSMELLAALPAIVALVCEKSSGPRPALALERTDWVEFFLDCLHSASESFTEAQRQSLADFLRLYIAVNADDEGGIPGTHVAQIMGSCQFDASRALAAGVLAYANEPTSGTLCQYMDFLVQLQNAVGREPKKDILRNFVNALIDKRFQIAGHKISQFEDTRYTVLRDFVKNHVPNDPEIKLSQDVSNIYTTQIKKARNRWVVAEQNAIAAPLFQFYGLRDMDYNQLLLCMSRALGIVASMIWTTALNSPVERPRSKCTYSYLSDFQVYGHRGRSSTSMTTTTKYYKSTRNREVKSNDDYENN